MPTKENVSRYSVMRFEAENLRTNPLNVGDGNVEFLILGSNSAYRFF